jgi:hypothetical protein
MDYELSIKMPNLPDDEEVQIAGLGTYKNNNKYKITDEEHDNFRRYHGQVVPVVDDDDEIIGSELELGPTLVKADIYGVTIKALREKKPESQEGDDS